MRPPPIVTGQKHSRGDTIFATCFACLCVVTLLLSLFAFIYFVGEYRKLNAGMGVLAAPFVLGFIFIAGAVAALAAILLTPRLLRGETASFWFATVLLAFPSAFFGLSLLFFIVQYPVIGALSVPWLALLVCGLYRGFKGAW
jgi:hypothetical protein